MERTRSVSGAMGTSPISVAHLRNSSTRSPGIWRACYPESMLTAGITAAIAALLSLFGVKPGAYLVGVAIGVKIVIVGVGLVFGARWLQRRQAKQATGQPPSGQDQHNDRPGDGRR